MTSHIIGLPERNPFFTGREDVLEKLHSALKKGAMPAITQPQAISGLGGIGKTQTAIEYAHRCKEKGEYQTIFFIKADTKENIEAGYAGIAKELELPEKDQSDLAVIVAAVKKWLSERQDWLLILDNADEVGMVKEYLPKGKGHTLLTTRAHAMGRIAQSIRLEKFSIKDGALFLLRRSKIIGQDEPYESASEAHRAMAEEISKEMDGLPLALDQAGAYIEETPTTLSKYLELYRKSALKLLGKQSDVGNDHDSVKVTFTLAFEKVAQQSPVAAEMIRVCGFLAPDAIAEEIFIEGGEHLGEAIAAVSNDEVAYEEAIREACRYSLIKRDPHNLTLEIHRLVQLVIKEGMEVEQRRSWVERIVNTLDKLFPFVEYPYWGRCERLITHARLVTKLIDLHRIESSQAGRLLHQSAYYLQERAQYTEAASLYGRSLTISEQVLGENHPSVASTLNNLAELYRAQGNYNAAAPLYERALVIRKQSLGENPPLVASTLNNLALLYKSQGKNESAEPLYERALAIYEQALGNNHPLVATTLNNLAELYRVQGNYSAAAPLYERALTISERALGENHPDVATTLNNLAALYDFQGNYSAAAPLYERALTITEQALGENHPDVASTLNNLAGLYYSQGNYDAAAPLYKRALAIFEQALGENHPSVASTLNNLAELYRMQGNYNAAAPLYERALAIYEQALGSNHPLVATTLNNLALMYYSQGKSKKSEENYQRAIRIIERSLGKEHPDWSTLMKNYADMLEHAGRLSDAVGDNLKTYNFEQLPTF